jgi:hypothetical protein
VRSEEQMNLKSAAVQKYWQDQPPGLIDYSEIDPASLKLFTGAHPKVVQDWLPKAEGIFKSAPNHQLTSREKKHRFLLKLEQLGIRFDKKHYRLVS